MSDNTYSESNSSFTNLVSDNCTLPVNTSCMHIHYKFKEFSWELTKNTKDKLVYVKPYHYNDCDEFKLEFSDNKIFVTIPVLRKNISYRTQFNSYFLAYEYIFLHLENYETSANNVYASVDLSDDTACMFDSF